jgi:arsenate reductase
MTAHWGIDDPSAVEGSEAERLRAFHRVYTDRQKRIRLFTRLRLELLNRLALQHEIRRIGDTKP